MTGNPEQRPDIILAVERHPADSDPLRARRQPQVLDRQAGAVQVGVADRVAAEDLAARLAVAADADAERRLADPLDLEVEVLARTLVEVPRLGQPLARGERLHRGLRAFVADHDEPPGLHQSDRRRLVGGLQHSRQHLRRDRLRAEAPDVAALADRPPHPVALALLEPAGPGVLPALARARVVEPGRQRRPLEPRAHLSELPRAQPRPRAPRSRSPRGPPRARPR